MIAVEWYVVLLIFFVALLVGFFFGFPVAFAFLTVNTVLMIMVVGFDSGIPLLVSSAFQSTANISYTPIMLFILMGNLLFGTGLVKILLDSVNKLLGRVPARLSVLTIITGAILAAMNGSAAGSNAMLCTSIAPEMEAQKYSDKLIIGPIISSSVLAVIIPPSALAVILGGLAQLSVGKLLMSGVIPGIMIAVFLCAYYMFLAKFVPKYHIDETRKEYTTQEKIRSFFCEMLPVAATIIVVLGLILLGWATPTESAAIGILFVLVLGLIYRRLTLKILLNALVDTIKSGGPVMLIMGMAAGFSQILSYTGATRSLIEWVMSLNLAPMVMVIIMLAVVILLGMFVDAPSVAVIVAPLFFPIINSYGMDPIWFGCVLLIALSMGNISPPFGVVLFMIKGLLPTRRPIKTIYSCAIDPCIIYIIAIAILLIFPPLTTWLPSIT